MFLNFVFDRIGEIHFCFRIKLEENMKVSEIKPSFKSLKVGRMSAIGRIYLSSYSEMEKLAEKADVFIKLSEKDFPYKNDKVTRMNCTALKISARPLNLSFWEKLAGKKTVTEYFPIGNMRQSVIYDKHKTVLDVVADVVSKVS